MSQVIPHSSLLLDIARTLEANNLEDQTSNNLVRNLQTRYFFIPTCAWISTGIHKKRR